MFLSFISWMKMSCSGYKSGRRLWRFEVERKPLLHAFHARTLSEIQKQRQVKNDRRGEDRVAAEEVDLDLHRIPEPAEDVDVVPAFFVVAARRVIVDSHDVRKVFV